MLVLCVSRRVTVIGLDQVVSCGVDIDEIESEYILYNPNNSFNSVIISASGRRCACSYVCSQPVISSSCSRKSASISTQFSMAYSNRERITSSDEYAGILMLKKQTCAFGSS